MRDVSAINRRVPHQGVVHFVWFQHGDDLGVTFACNQSVRWTRWIDDATTDAPVSCFWCMCGLSR